MQGVQRPDITQCGMYWLMIRVCSIALLPTFLPTFLPQVSG